MAKDSLKKASTPEPFSRSRTSNWVARGGGLPAYIQHIAHDLVEKRGKSESKAIQMAIGIVKRWAKGLGNVDANTRAAAAKAVAEWEKLKAKTHAKSAVKEAAEDEFSPEEQALIDGYEPPRYLFVELDASELGDLSALEAPLSTKGRKKLPASAFAIPPDRYPIHDINHARNALARASGKPEEGRVKAAVYRRYPELRPKAKAKS